MAEALQEFHVDGEMKGSTYRECIVDEMEGLMWCNHLTRDHKEC